MKQSLLTNKTTTNSLVSKNSRDQLNAEAILNANFDTSTIDEFGRPVRRLRFTAPAPTALVLEPPGMRVKCTVGGKRRFRDKYLCPLHPLPVLPTFSSKFSFYFLFGALLHSSFHFRSLPVSFLFHSYSIPIPIPITFLFHSHSIPHYFHSIPYSIFIPFVFHSHSIPIPFPFHSPF